MPALIFILVLALVVLGPKKLSELGRQLGKALAEFKKASNGFKDQLETEMLNIELEERTKRQRQDAELPKILPPEPSRELSYRPAQAIVSRGAAKDINASDDTRRLSAELPSRGPGEAFPILKATTHDA